MVGIPIGWRGTSGLLSTASQLWLSVNGEDYLQRGPQELSEKLANYLQSQGVDYPFAYLVTAPRFLGFSFNPVSFWYLYDQDKELRAMILEVNNTFDERRMYFLKMGEQTWKKDFHVSPFNDREGVYSLTAKDPRDGIDNNIVLTDGKPKLVARIYSTETIDPASFSLWQNFVFVIRWCWVGFLTNPRILREARLLWIKRLKVFYRPEPLKTSIGRNQTPEEDIIERVFLRFLDRIGKETEVEISCNGQLLGAGETKLSLQVLTSAFYHELALSSNLAKTLQRLCFSESLYERMAHVDGSLDIISPDERKPSSIGERLLVLLRGRGLSQLDIFARQDRNYIIAASIICAASRFTFGSTWLLRTCGKILRLGLLFGFARWVGFGVHSWRPHANNPLSGG